MEYCCSRCNNRNFKQSSGEVRKGTRSVNRAFSFASVRNHWTSPDWLAPSREVFFFLRLHFRCFNQRVYMMYSLLFRCGCILLLATVLNSTSGNAAEPVSGSAKHVLVVNSFSSSDLWTDELMQGFRSEVNAGDAMVNFDIFELGVLSQRGIAPAPDDIAALQKRVSERRFDLVVAENNDAADLFLSGRIKLPKEIPLLLMSYHGLLSEKQQTTLNMTGVTSVYHPYENARYGLALLPDIRKFILVVGTAADNLRQKQMLELIPPELRDKFVIISGEEHTTAELLEQLSQQPPDTLLLFNSWSSSREKVPVNSYQTLPEIRKIFPGLILGRFDSYIKLGSSGGCVASGFTQGRQAGKLALRILNGGNASEIPIEKGEIRFLFNEPDLAIHHISANNLPAGTTLVNVPLNFFQKHYAWLLAAVIVLLVVLAFFIAYQMLCRMVQRKIEAVFKHLPFHIGIFDRCGRALFHHSPNFADGKTTQKITNFKQFCEPARSLLDRALQEAFSTGKPVEFDYQENGRFRHGEILRLPARNPFHADVVLWISIDQTELISAHRATTEIAEHFRLTLESIGDGVIATDREERITLLNPVAEKLTGYSLDEARGKKLDEIFHLKNSLNGKEVQSPLGIALRNGASVELANHTSLIDRYGERRHIADCASPICNVQGHITGGVLIFRDVTAEYENRDRMRLHSAILTTIGEIANFSYFRCDSNGQPLFYVREKFWPRRDGKPLPIGEWVSPEHQGAVIAAWKDFYAGKTAELYVAYTAGAPRRFYELRAMKSQHPLTGQNEYFGLILDVTHIREEEQRHRYALQLLTSIMDGMQGYIFVKNADDGFRYLMANSKFREISGMRSEEMIGRSDLEIFAHSPKAVARYRKDDEALLASGGTLEIREVIPLYDGGEVVVQTVKSILTREDGARLLLGLSIDVTEQNRLEKEREKLLEELKSYVGQEKLLNRIWERLMTKLDDQEVFTEILKTIVGYMGAYTSYIYRSDPAQGTDTVYAHFLAGDEPIVPLEDYPVMPINPDAEWFKMTMNHQIWEVTDTETEEARRIQGEWNRYMPKLKVRALCGIGLWLNGEFWGYMGFSFHAPQQPLSAQQKFLLASMAHITEIFLERKRSRQYLDRSEHEKRLILDTMNIPVMLFDPDMKLIRCNNAALKIAGMEEEEVYRLGCRAVFCCEKERSQACPVQQTHNDLQEHTRKMCLNGREYLLRSNPILIDGKLVYIMKTMLDVTEFNAIQKELTAALEQAQAANKAKSYFLATMSHEIRTPLNAVIGFSELLKSGGLSEREQMEYLDSINLAGNSLLRLINDVLDLSKLEAEQTVFTPQPTDVAGLLQEIEAIFQYKVQEKGLYFRIEGTGQLPVLKLDGSRLRQILLNLIGNAVKFTANGGITLEVDFKSGGPKHGRLSIQVRDTGIGITEEAQQRIFNPFVQSDAKRDTHIYGGTGLGLAICRRLAERMNGRITLESEVDRGSCFTLVLENAELADGISPEASSPVAEPLKTRKLRVLLVDDIPINLKVLLAMLNKIGADGVCAESGEKAWEILRKDPNFDLILTDLWMPDMGGAELARKIHADSATAGLPVIAVTADAQMPANKVREFQGILLKPVSREALKAILKHYNGV